MFDSTKPGKEGDRLSPDSPPYTRQRDRYRRLNWAVFLVFTALLLLLVILGMTELSSRKYSKPYSSTADAADIIPYKIGEVSYPKAAPAESLITTAASQTIISATYDMQNGLLISNKDGETRITFPRPWNDPATPQLEINATVEDGRYIVESLHIRFKREH